MPNWVTNQLTITGKPADLLRLANQLNTSYNTKEHQGVFDSSTAKSVIKLVDVTYENPVFSFYNVIPHANDTSYYGDGGDNQGNWYEWNNNFWNTKWDIVERVWFKYDGDTQIIYGFDTAWSPPYPVIERLVIDYPELTFEYQWLEEQGYGGVGYYQKGEACGYREWEVPQSHADIEYLKTLGLTLIPDCPCEWLEEEYFFTDCPVPIDTDDENNNNCLDPQTVGTTTSNREE